MDQRPSPVVFRCEPLSGRSSRRYSLLRGGHGVDFGTAVSLWRGDAGFRRLFSRVLAEAPFEAFFWETPAVTRSTVSRPFEFVLVDAPPLAGVRADRGAFADRFTGADVVTFPNLGGDALLVAPAPGERPAARAHLAAFVRGAPEARQDSLWRAVGEAFARELGERPLWTSTSGLGVYWLHVRLDSAPKYYTHAPYREG